MLEPLGHNDNEHLIDVIIVPGINAIEPDEWHWLNELNKTISSARTWAYRYAVQDARIGIVDSIRQHAEGLLADLTAHHEHVQSPHPICFICHSLGGLVLKRALKHVSQYWYDYRTIADTLSGIIFLGTPHTALDGNKGNVFENITNCFPSRAGTALSNNDQMELDQIGRRFEEIGVTVPVVSVYERDRTKFKLRTRVLMSHHRKEIVVGEAQVKFISTTCEIAEAPADHRNIALLPIGCNALLKVLSLIKDIAREAPGVVAERFKSRGPPTGLIHNTIRSQSVQDLDGMKPEVGRKDIVLEPNRNDSYGSADAVTGTTEGSFELLARKTPAETSEPKARLTPVSKAIRALRTPDRRLYGREKDILAIDEKLLDPDSRTASASVAPGPRSFVIHGMGGIGKTTLARHWVWTRRRHFDAVFWLKASKLDSLAGEFVGIGTGIALFGTEETQDLAVGREVVKGWLSNPRYTISGSTICGSEARWLIVFDDAESLAGLADYWPFGSQGTVLVTTRDASGGNVLSIENNFAGSLPLFGTLELKPISIAETQSMLLHMTPGTSDSSNTDVIAAISQKLGGLPLAIQQMAGNIRTMNLRYADLLNMWESENPAEFLDTSAGCTSVTSSELRQTIATMWMSKIDCSDQPEDLALLRVLSFLAPGGVAEELVGGPGFLSSDIPFFPASTLRFHRVKVSLIKSSRITYQKHDRTILVHDLVKESVRAHIDRENASAMLLMVARAVSRSWPFLEAQQWHDRSRWLQCEKVMPHITFLRELWSASKYEMVNSKLGLEFAKLVNEAGWYLLERGLPEQSRKYFATVEVICEKSGGNDSTELSEILRCCSNYQGAAATETGDCAAALFYNNRWRQLYMEHKGRRGQDHADHEEAYIWNETGLAYGLNQAFVKAEMCFRRSADTMRSLPDFKPTMLDYALPNLGLVLWVQGKPLEAKMVLDEIRQSCEKEYGLDDTLTFKTGKILYALGNVYHDLGDFELSLAYHRRAFEQYSKTHGTKHFRTADTSYRLADHYLRLGDLALAEKLLNSAIMMYSSSKIYSASLARTLFKMSKIQAGLKNHDACISLKRRAYTIRRELRPDDCRCEAELEQSDFDDLVMFWSR